MNAVEAELESLFAKSTELYAAGHWKEAKEIATGAQLRARRELGDEHRLSFVGFAQLGELERAMGNLVSAKSMLEHAVKLGTTASGATDPLLVGAIHDLGRLRLDEGDLARAEEQFVDALERSRRRGPSTPEVAVMLTALGHVQILRGSFAKAEALLREALPMLPPDHPEALRTMHHLGCAVGQAGRFEEAEPLLVAALERQRVMLGPDHPDTIESMASLATLYFAAKEPTRAEPLYRQALEATRRVHGAEHPLLADRLVDDAMSSALPALEEALAIRRRRLGPKHPRTVSVVEAIANVRRALGVPNAQLDENRPVSLELAADHVIDYRTGEANAPGDPWGAISLTLHGDGRLSLHNQGPAGAREWSGRVESAAIAQVLGALKTAGFPVVKSHLIPPGSNLRVVSVRSAGRESHTFPMAWRAAEQLGYGPVFALLDGLIVQTSGGVLAIGRA